jgi:dTDP-4-dehydrorhamnose 3,5-epimerase-like enzyme
MNHPELIDLGKVGKPELGYISVAEAQQNIPFEIKRVYWTYYTPQDVLRGHHSHKKLQQVIFAVKGIIRFKFENAAGDTYEFTLDRPEIGIYIPSGFWREIQFSHDAVLLCLASEKFTEEDYIRDYEEFKRG